MDRVDDTLESVYLQNPPECIRDEIIRSYRKEDVEVKRYKYRSIGKKQLVEAFQNFRHARNLIKNDINQILVEDFLR